MMGKMAGPREQWKMENECPLAPSFGIEIERNNNVNILLTEGTRFLAEVA